MTTKVCTKCKVEKDVGEFYNRKASKDGLMYECKSCVKSRVLKWVAENPERVAEKFRKWAAENPERVAESRRRWRVENHEKATEQSRRWRAENLERFREIARNNYRRSVVRLSDAYVKRVLNVTNPPQELIELKRLQLQIHRELKQQGEVR